MKLLVAVRFNIIGTTQCVELTADVLCLSLLPTQPALPPPPHVVHLATVCSFPSFFNINSGDIPTARDRLVVYSPSSKACFWSETFQQCWYSLDVGNPSPRAPTSPPARPPRVEQQKTVSSFPACFNVNNRDHSKTPETDLP